MTRLRGSKVKDVPEVNIFKDAVLEL